MEISWSEFKNIVTLKGLSIQYVQVQGNYWLKLFDGYFTLDCFIPTDETNPDTSDFVTNFKAAGNKTIVNNSNIQNQPPYGSKTVTVSGVTKKLYARFTGAQYAVTAGSNTLTYTATYPWAKIIGVECINCEALDTVDLKVYDTAAGTYSGYPNALLNQFSYAMNLPKDYYLRYSQFDADIYQGMIIQMTYVSQSNKTIGFNFLLDEVKS